MSESLLVGLSCKQIQLQPYKVIFEWYHIHWQMNRAPGHCGGETACIMGLEGHIWLTSFWKRVTALNSRWRIKREKQRVCFFPFSPVVLFLCDELKVCHFYSLTVSDFTTEECLILLNGERASWLRLDLTWTRMHTGTKKCSLLHAKLKEAKSNTEREFVSTSEIMSNSFHMDASDNIHINGSQTEHVWCYCFE